MITVKNPFPTPYNQVPLRSLTGINYDKNKTSFIGKTGNRHFDELYLIMCDRIVLASDFSHYWTDKDAVFEISGFVNITISVDE